MAAPNTFSDKTGQIALTLLDENFEYVDTSLSSLQNNIDSVQTQLNNLDLTTLEGNTEITGDLTVPSLFADNIGIGTTTPSTDIHIKSAGSVGITLEADTGNVTESDIPTIFFKQDGGLVNYNLGINNTNNFEIESLYNTGNIKLTTISGATEITKLHSPGTIVQTQTARSGPARQTISSTSPVAITGLSIAFTPKFASSKIIIVSNVVHTKGHVISFGYYKGSSKVVSTSGYGNSNEPNMNVTYYTGSDNNQLVNSTIIHEEDALSTSARTYTLRSTGGWSGTTYTHYINNRSNNDMASFSYMTIYEVAQ